MNNFQQSLLHLESSIALANSTIEHRSSHLRVAREALKHAIVHVCGISIDSPMDRLSEVIDRAMKNHTGRRESSILLVRALAVDDLLPFKEDHLLESKVVELVESGFKDQCRGLELEKKRQTYEKLDALKGLHEAICSNLTVLKELPVTVAEISGMKAPIQKALHHKQCGAYLQPYDWNRLKGKLLQACEHVTDLAACKDSTYKARFDHLVELSNELREIASASITFLHREYIAPFSKAVEDSLAAIKTGAADHFACLVEPRRKAPHLAEKRYPLHQEGKLLTITVPFINSGPGVAVDVTIELDCGTTNTLALDTQRIHLGDIPPGEFAVSFKALVVKEARTVGLVMQVSWNQLFGNFQEIILDVQLTGQDSAVDWMSLEQLDPYSLEVAEGDKFVGRKAKVQAIGNRLLKAQMSSTYITGQKRIGKTSLAQAVLRYVTAHAVPPITYEAVYLEWGEYCEPDAEKTVKALGELIYAFLRDYLPDGLGISLVFEGSLASLNRIAKLLESARPDKRFIIVLDEFDEIHPEMYRYGSLAEAFFANLRTLGARKNLAFILVGGEKMPFIIGAQGDQLNKFVRESLDYFSRSQEWTDYVELVSKPVNDSLNWEEAALNELFSATNGHPYYTKLLCAKVFSTAVAERDTEIITSDIRHAMNGLVAELDTNVFAHFWKDGINAERKEAEVIELKRLRALVAFGRAVRLGVPTKLSIAERATTGLQSSEMGPLVEDFCRRDIMKEIGGDILMQLPIFQRWVRDIGVSKLITSTLADELESELLKANDAAYVRSSEIEALIKNWPLYRGRQITGESVRAWLEQVADTQEQRMLFTILLNLKFVSPAQIADLLRQAHERIVARATPPRVRESKLDKRRDLLVTYLEGPGKSGIAYARAYAKENELLMECIVDPNRAVKRITVQNEQPSAVLVVDDIAGTGRSVAGSLQLLLEEIGSSLSSRKIPLFVIILLATEDAERKIQSTLDRYRSIKSKLHVCQILGNENRAFHDEGAGFWGDLHLRDRAKAMCIQLGSGRYKDPLGFGGQSLLVAFPDTCPNNCLPIIFASRSGEKPWNALLPRPAS